ncbi:MAG: hypothetical protein LBR68_02530, partial [Lachnoclostridium sp.]|nr:hypothetical protein [Lachnoclostridium sp.]
MLRFIKQKLVHKKWMVICLLVGNVLLIAIAGSNPMYQNAALKRSLDSRLSDMITQESKNPGEITFSASVQKETANQGPVYEKVREMSEQLADNLDVSQLYNVRFHSLSKMRARVLTKREEKTDTKEMQLCALSDMDEHTRILAGEMYSPEPDANGVYSVIVSQRTMTRLNLLLGDEFEFLSVVTGGKPVKIRITGVFENDKMEDPYWVTSPSEYSTQCFIDDELFRKEFIQTEDPK